MMKKRMWLVGGIIGILILLVGVGYLYQKYTTALYANWSIRLSINYTEVYSNDSGPSFLGDGERYHVFRYKDINDIENDLECETKKNTIVENNVIQIIDNLKIDSKYQINFNQTYKYYEKYSGDGSSLYLILIDNLLYVVESFF